QLSQARINEADIKSRLAQAQDALINAQKDSSKEFAGKQSLEVEVKKFKDALRNAQIERDAAEEQALLFTNRVSTLKATATSVAKKEVEKQIKETQRKLDQLTEEHTIAVKERDDFKTKNAQLNAKVATATQELAALTKLRDT